MGKSATTLLILCLAALSYVESQDRYGPEIHAIDGSDMMEMTDAEKRSGLKAVPFSCNGYDHVPRCQNGGKGPRKTQTRSGNICVCLCPQKWMGPQCNTPTGDNAIGKRDDEQFDEGDKRTWGSLKSLQLGKRMTLPWALKQIKRNLPWALKAYPVRREDGTVYEDDAVGMDEDKRTFPWALKAMPGKKTLPWALKAVPGKKHFPWALKTMDGQGKRNWSFNSVPLGKRSSEGADTD